MNGQNIVSDSNVLAEIIINTSTAAFYEFGLLEEISGALCLCIWVITEETAKIPFMLEDSNGVKIGDIKFVSHETPFVQATDGLFKIVFNLDDEYYIENRNEKMSRFISNVLTQLKNNKHFLNQASTRIMSEPRGSVWMNARAEIPFHSSHDGELGCLCNG